jgi:hypothetical protein
VIDTSANRMPLLVLAFASSTLTTFDSVICVAASLTSGPGDRAREGRDHGPSPGLDIGVPQPERARVAQSLQGISTRAWGCQSAAPATPGCRPPHSGQLCRRCLSGTGRGTLQRRGLVGHHKQTIGKVGDRTKDSSSWAMRFVRHHPHPVETPCCEITRNVAPPCRQLLQSWVVGGGVNLG